MARRPDPSEFDRPLSREEIAELQRTMGQLTGSQLVTEYRRAHEACQLRGETLPRAIALQQLVSAWKALRNWRLRRPPRRE